MHDQTSKSNNKMMLLLFLGNLVISFHCEPNGIATIYCVLGHIHSIIFPGYAVYTLSMMEDEVSVTRVGFILI